MLRRKERREPWTPKPPIVEGRVYGRWTPEQYARLKGLPGSKKVKRVVRWAGAIPKKELLWERFALGFIPAELGSQYFRLTGHPQVANYVFWPFYIGGFEYFDRMLKNDRFGRSMWAAVGNPRLSKKIAEGYTAPQKELLLNLGNLRVPAMGARERMRYRKRVSDFLAKNKRKISALRRDLISYSKGQYAVGKQLKQRLEGNSVAIGLFDEYVRRVEEINRQARPEIVGWSRDGKAMVRDPAKPVIESLAEITAHLLALAESGIEFGRRHV
jgi:hypothetical protein